MNFLNTVLPVKQQEVNALKKSFDENRFAQLFKNSKNKPVFIAEIKPKSPSAGKLIQGDPLRLVSVYEQGRADAISVLTDKKFFGGSNDLFSKVRRKTNMPLLRKEFIIDEVQVFESLRLQADAILLIAQLLTPIKLKRLVRLSKAMGIVPLVEVINEAELETAIKSGTQFIGVNSRNLQTMGVDQEKALAILKKIPESIHALLFSGIENEDQVRAAIQSGAEGLLIGTSLLKAENPEQKLLRLREAAREELC